MENVRTILVDIDALDVLAIDISTQMITFVYHQAFLAMLIRKVGKGSSIKTGADYEIVIFKHSSGSFGANAHEITGTNKSMQIQTQVPITYANTSLDNRY